MSSNDQPEYLTPIYVNLVITMVLALERVVKYFIKMIGSKGRTRCGFESCCGLCGAHLVTEESQKTITISTGTLGGQDETDSEGETPEDDSENK